MVRLYSYSTCVPPQAEALPRLCFVLRIAEGLRELVIDLHGRAAYTVPAKFGNLGRLTQLESLQLSCVAIDADREQLTTALSPLTRLTRLFLLFEPEKYSHAQGMPSFPWEAAVCGLTNLQELDVSSKASADHANSSDLFKGALPAALSQLTALRRLTILGMKESYSTDNSDELQLAALPALETVSFRLRTLRSHYPSLNNQLQYTSSRLVSLSLALRVDSDDYYEDTQLPRITAPAMTELVLDGLKLAPHSEQLIWLPGLPKLQRLVLTDVETGSTQLPLGVMACSGLTELVLQRFFVRDCQSQFRDYGTAIPLRSLPPGGPYLSQLVCLSLAENAFSAVPPSLAAATALEVLDMGKQRLAQSNREHHGDPVQGLHVLLGLTRLRCVNLEGFNQGPTIRQCFRVARPDVTVTW